MKKQQIKVPTARQLPSGSWFVRLRIDGRDIAITRPTQKEAVAEAMAVKAGIKEATKRTPSKSLTDAIDAYIDARRNILSPSTIRGYKIIQNNRFPTMMHRDVYAVTDDQWQRAVNLEAREVSAKTLTNSWRFVSSVIHETTGHIVSIRLPQIVPNERPWLEPDQIPTFVSAVKGTTIEIPALLALSSLRCSELLNLRWSDIDLAGGTLQVNGAAVPDEDGKLVRKRETKNRTSRRTVPIIPPLHDALSRVEHRSEYVVRITANGLYKHINRICAANDLPEVGIHGLRHSFASLAFHLQMPEKIAMEIGGWADDHTMRRIYTHLAKKDLAKHTSALTSFFTEAPAQTGNTSENGNENGNAN